MKQGFACHEMIASCKAVKLDGMIETIQVEHLCTGCQRGNR